MHTILTKCTEAEFLDEIQREVFAIQSHLYSFSLRFLFFSNSRNLLQFLQKSEISEDYAQKPQRNCIL
jgi:hypothetical protein